MCGRPELRLHSDHKTGHKTDHNNIKVHKLITSTNHEPGARKIREQHDRSTDTHGSTTSTLGGSPGGTVPEAPSRSQNR